LRAGRAAVGAPVEPAEIEKAVDDAFAHLDDPTLTLFHVRRATVGLAKLLHMRYVGPLPADIDFDRLIDLVVLAGATPADVQAPLALLHRFCRHAVAERIEDPLLLTNDIAAPAVTALRVLTDRMFPEHRARQTLETVWETLPIVDGLTGRRIPGTGYRLREPCLGVNSLGPVYPGHDDVRKEPVSVNLVALPENADDRFLEEAARFCRLSGPNIIAPKDAGRIVVDGERLCLYLVLPALDGIDAQELLDRNGPLPPRAAVELALGIATALAGFHGADPPVVHGDIKPASVFVSRFGAVGVLCIGHQVASASAAALSQNAVGRVDSYHFASPEQRAGRALTPATDLFALRAVLSYLLTGVHDGRLASPETVRPTAMLDGCHTAHEAARVLRDMPGGESLAAVARRHLPEVTAGPQLRLQGRIPMAARAAWPLGDDAVLVWEHGSRTLAVFRGDELEWRDDQPIPVRRTASGPRGRFAVGGWNGAVRCFTDGSPTASTRLDGAVGDLVYTDDGLIAGSWNRALCRIADDGTVRHLLAVDRGVHRIAVSNRADRFTVADQSGGLLVYAGDRRTDELPSLGPVRDIAYAGNRLIVLGEETIGGVRLDGSRTDPGPAPGGSTLRPLADPGQCLLIAVPEDAVVQAWRIDESERRLLSFSLPPRERVLAVTPGGDRLTVARAVGGCAYRRDGAEVGVWPEAVTASVSDDGRMVTVVRPDRVDLYEDTA